LRPDHGHARVGHRLRAAARAGTSRRTQPQRPVLDAGRPVPAGGTGARLPGGGLRRRWAGVPRGLTGDPPPRRRPAHRPVLVPARCRPRRLAPRARRGRRRPGRHAGRNHAGHRRGTGGPPARRGGHLAGTTVYQLPALTSDVIFAAAGRDGYDQAAVLAADAPDLPGMLVGKLLRPLSSRPVSVAPALTGGLLGLAA